MQREKAPGGDAVADCRFADIVVVNVAADEVPGCEIFDMRRLRKTGSLAFYRRDGSLVMETARAMQGARLWSQ